MIAGSWIACAAVFGVLWALIASRLTRDRDLAREDIAGERSEIPGICLEDFGDLSHPERMPDRQDA
jgi:hypothetical protein